MQGETFKRFAIYSTSVERYLHGYTLLCDLENRALVYRDTLLRACFESLASIRVELDMSKAYAKAADDRCGTEFVRAFELTEEDVAVLVPMLGVDEFVRAKERAKSEPLFLVQDDSDGMRLGFEGYTGSATPLFQIKNAYDYSGFVLPLRELHDWLVERFGLRALPGFNWGRALPVQRKSSRKTRGWKRMVDGL